MSLEIERVEMLDILHSVDRNQLNWLVDAVNPETIADGYIIIDLFSGNGIGANTIIQGLQRKNINPSLHIMVDKFKPILESAQLKITHKSQVQTLQVDLSKDFPNIDPGCIDIVVVKMGLHELPLTRQRELLVQVYSHLKPGGQLVIWENNIVKQDGKDLYGFNQIITEKDRLAGLSELVIQRYFTSEEEIVQILDESGFKRVQVAHQWVRIWDSYDRLNTEFRGDTQKLERLNAQIDLLIREEYRENAGYLITQGGLGRSFNVLAQILTAIK